MNPLAMRQVELNLTTDDRWDAFAEHRGVVTELLTSGATGGTSRLCVLGAGNANDLDLPLLLQRHQEVHLVDLDGEALARGVARQGLADSPAVVRHGGLDVTGVFDEPFESAEVSALSEAPLRRVLPALPGPFDVVASTCLLSQLTRAVGQAVGERHPRFVELIQAVRAGHLQLLLQLTAPGGVAVLITDVVSSETFSALTSTPREALPGLLPDLARSRNFFHGVNPFVIEPLFHTLPELTRLVTEVQPIDPWRWSLGPRSYLVWAVKVTRKL